MPSLSKATSHPAPIGINGEPRLTAVNLAKYQSQVTCPLPKQSDQHLNIPKSAQLSHQNSSISSTVRTPMDANVLDPMEPKCIASFLLPYTVTRDHKNPAKKFKIKLSIHKHAILYGSLL